MDRLEKPLMAMAAFSSAASHFCSACLVLGRVRVALRAPEEERRAGAKPPKREEVSLIDLPRNAGFGFLHGGGEAGRLIRTFDWSATSLGSPERWPQSLRSALSICLNSSFPTAIYWGPELRLLYNDAWAPVPGERHPWALGRPGAQVWADIWDVVGPQFASVMEGGEGFSTYDQMLPLVRDGERRETYWNYSLTPIRGEDGSVVGIFNQGHETTRRVFAERRARFLLDLSDRLRAVSDPQKVIEKAQEALGRHLRANRVGYGDVDETARYFTTQRNWTDETVPSREGTHDLADFGPEVLAALRAGVPLLIADIRRDPRTNAPERLAAFDAIDVRAAITASLVKDGQMRAALYVHARSARQWTEEDAELVTEVAERTWSAVERARAEAMLRQSEAQFRLMASAVPQIVWITDADGRTEYFNEQWADYTGNPEFPKTAAEVASHHVHPDDVGPTMAAFAKAKRIGDVFQIEHRIRAKDGLYRWFLVRAEPFRDPETGDILRWFGASTDIHDRKIAEERLLNLNEALETRVAERTGQLAASERRFRGIFDSALQFMALLTPGGAVIEVNRTALSWSQIEPAEIVGKPFWLAAPMRENPALQAAVEAGVRRAAAGETVRGEHEMRGAGEARAVVDFSLKPVLGERDEVIWLVAEGRDITELKHAQDALRQTQKLEAVGQLTGGVAHDFNNLLTVIKSSSDLLRKPGLSEERRRRYVDAIADTVDRASKLTAQLLAFARRQALKPEVFDPANRIRSITDMLRTLVGSRVEIITDLACEPCFVEADANQFETAIVNMVVNARDAMDGEGTLTIRVAAETRTPPSRGQTGGPGPVVAMSISDTGHGIPEDKLAQIFEPFFTTKEVGKGTGLGLSQVHGFAQQSGGDIAVESRVGRGATFTLYLPRVGEPAASGAESLAKDAWGPEEGHGLRVLVVEDNSEVGAFTTQILRDLGYRTTLAGDANDALRLLADVGGFDVVFSDVVMPGMNGVDLGKEIRTCYPGLPVVLTSGYSHVLAEEGRHGFELIQKPYAAEDVSRVLRKVTIQQQAPQAAVRSRTT